MGKPVTKKEKKEYYDKRVCVMLEEFTQALICVADNVGSKQFQDIRAGLRPESVVLMGKNTLLKRTIRQYVEKTGATQWLAMLPLLVVSSSTNDTQPRQSESRYLIERNSCLVPCSSGHHDSLVEYLIVTRGFDLDTSRVL